MPRKPRPIQLESRLMPANDGLRLDEDQRLLPSRPEPPQHHPEQFIGSGNLGRGCFCFKTASCWRSARFSRSRSRRERKARMDRENRCRNSRSTCQCYTRTGRSDLADHPIDSRPDIHIDEQHIQLPGTCFQKGDWLDNPQGTTLGFAWQSASWLKRIQPFALQGHPAMSFKNTSCLLAFLAAGLGLAVYAQAPPATPVTRGGNARGKAGGRKATRNRDRRDPGELRRIEGAGPYTLPDALKLDNGKPVRDAKTWNQKRRPEIVSLFETQQYGVAPGRPAEELRSGRSGNTRVQRQGDPQAGDDPFLERQQRAVERRELAGDSSGGLSSGGGEEAGSDVSEHQLQPGAKLGERPRHHAPDGVGPADEQARDAAGDARGFQLRPIPVESFWTRGSAWQPSTMASGALLRTRPPSSSGTFREIPQPHR